MQQVKQVQQPLLVLEVELVPHEQVQEASRVVVRLRCTSLPAV